MCWYELILYISSSQLESLYINPFNQFSRWIQRVRFKVVFLRRCWDINEDSPYWWIIKGPIVVSIAVNTPVVLVETKLLIMHLADYHADVFVYFRFRDGFG